MRRPYKVTKPCVGCGVANTGTKYPGHAKPYHLCNACMKQTAIDYEWMDEAAAIYDWNKE